MSVGGAALRWTGLALLVLAPTAQAVAPPTPADVARCEVWARELSFAQSVADHDAAAFAAHLHPLAVFGVTRPNPQRGEREILDAWAGLIAGRETRLWWYPEHVHAGGDASIVSSSGPALYQDLASGRFGEADQYRAGFDMSYEVDLFGRVRRSLHPRRKRPPRGR